MHLSIFTDNHWSINYWKQQVLWHCVCVCVCRCVCALIRISTQNCTYTLKAIILLTITNTWKCTTSSCLCLHCTQLSLTTLLIQSPATFYNPHDLKELHPKDEQRLHTPRMWPFRCTDDVAVRQSKHTMKPPAEVHAQDQLEYDTWSTSPLEIFHFKNEHVL